MTTNSEGAPDPNAGRFAIWIAGGLGIAAIVAYGSYHAQQRLAAREQASQPIADAEPAASRTPAAASTVLDRAHRAADAFDVGALAELDRALQTSAARSTDPDEAAKLRIARASALSVRALEASIRAHRTDAAGAKAELAATLAEARALTDALTEAGVEPAAVGRVEARLDLAQGRDITLLHPVVLMADYPDADLRLAALGRPLFTDTAFVGDELDQLTVELRRADPATGLTQLLLAMALEAGGDRSAALAEAKAVLSQIPGQPLAIAIQAPPVARGTSIEPEPEPEPEKPESAPEEPEPTEPEPAKPEPAKPEPVKPEPAKPEPENPEPEKPETAKPEPDKQPRGRPRREKKDFDTLLDEGCDLVRKGDAAQGFKVLKQAHDLEPGGAKVTLCMAQAQDELGRAASALALVDRVIRKSPKNKTALLLAARLEAGQGNQATADDYYRRVLAIDPDNAKAKKALGEE